MYQKGLRAAVLLVLAVGVLAGQHALASGATDDWCAWDDGLNVCIDLQQCCPIPGQCTERKCMKLSSEPDCVCIDLLPN